MVSRLRYSSVDNAAENEKFEKKIIKLGIDTRFEFSAPDTPQQNGVVERAFAMLYDRVQAMLNYANIEGDIRKSLWAECGKTATDLDGILYRKDQTENSYMKMFKKIQALSVIYVYLVKWGLSSHTSR